MDKPQTTKLQKIIIGLFALIAIVIGVYDWDKIFSCQKKHWHFMSGWFLNGECIDDQEFLYRWEKINAKN